MTAHLQQNPLSLLLAIHQGHFRKNYTGPAFRLYVTVGSQSLRSSVLQNEPSGIFTVDNSFTFPYGGEALVRISLLTIVRTQTCHDRKIGALTVNLESTHQPMRRRMPIRLGRTTIGHLDLHLCYSSTSRLHARKCALSLSEHHCESGRNNGSASIKNIIKPRDDEYRVALSTPPATTSSEGPPAQVEEGDGDFVSDEMIHALKFLSPSGSHSLLVSIYKVTDLFPDSQACRVIVSVGTLVTASPQDKPVELSTTSFLRELHTLPYNDERYAKLQISVLDCSGDLHTGRAWIDILDLLNAPMTSRQSLEMYSEQKVFLGRISLWMQLSPDVITQQTVIDAVPRSLAEDSPTVQMMQCDRTDDPPSVTSRLLCFNRCRSADYGEALLSLCDPKPPAEALLPFLPLDIPLAAGVEHVLSPIDAKRSTEELDTLPPFLLQVTDIRDLEVMDGCESHLLIQVFLTVGGIRVAGHLYRAPTGDVRLEECLFYVLPMANTSLTLDFLNMSSFGHPIFLGRVNLPTIQKSRAQVASLDKSRTTIVVITETQAELRYRQTCCLRLRRSKDHTLLPSARFPALSPRPTLLALAPSAETLLIGLRALQDLPRDESEGYKDCIIEIASASGALCTTSAFQYRTKKGCFVNALFKLPFSAFAELIVRVVEVKLGGEIFLLASGSLCPPMLIPDMPCQVHAQLRPSGTLDLSLIRLHEPRRTVIARDRSPQKPSLRPLIKYEESR